MQQNPNHVTKLIYCSRTVPEMEKVVEELRKLLARLSSVSRCWGMNTVSWSLGFLLWLGRLTHLS